jgi:hypothetical protein
VFLVIVYVFCLVLNLQHPAQHCTNPAISSLLRYLIFPFVAERKTCGKVELRAKGSSVAEL